MSTAVLSRDNISESVILDAVSKPAVVPGKDIFRYSVQQAPQASEGIRRKRKLLSAVSESKKPGLMEFQFLTAEQCDKIAEHMINVTLEFSKSAKIVGDRTNSLNF